MPPQIQNKNFFYLATSLMTVKQHFNVLNKHNAKLQSHTQVKQGNFSAAWTMPQ